MIRFILALSFCFPLCLTARETSPAKIRALYSSLQPDSISEYLAFYQLYSETNEGKKALMDAWQLLNKKGQRISFSSLPNISSALGAIVNIINKEANEQTVSLSEEDLDIINKLSSHLSNRKLKGYKALTEADVVRLEPSEIDLARGLFLSQLGTSPEALKQIESYEASIDLMALQILSQLPPQHTHQDLIKKMNHFIFTEMGFRFPPHSLYAKDIDVYTFLPSVLDSRKGVCLGVSILYLSLAQRLDLSLEMITPPGHIFVRYNDGHEIINIETTARGINIDSEDYLNIDTCQLQKRNIKEVIGFAHVNHASIYLQEAIYDKSLDSYKKAQPYLKEDCLLKELMGFNYLFVGQENEAQKMLIQIKDHIPDISLTKSSTVEDYLNGKADAECIKTIFLRVDENRESVIKKKEALEGILKRYPQFRAGLSSLATTWLQLHRVSEALVYLEKLYDIDPSDPTTNYYLSALYAERMDYNKAWKHLLETEKIVQAKNHFPNALKELRRELETLSPE